VMAERVAEVHVKAPNARPISDEAAALAASTLASNSVGWRMFQWLQRSPIPDRAVVDCTARRVMNVNTAVKNFRAMIANHGNGLLAKI